MSKLKNQNKLEVSRLTNRSSVCCALAVGLGLSMFAGTGVAQDDAKPEGERPDRERRERPRQGAGGGAGGFPLMRALDLNGDRELDQSEIDMAVVSLRKMDKNGDGKISGAELWGGARGDRPTQPGGNATRQRLDFSKIDQDGDGKISKEEAPEGMRERFDRMDRNGDGFLDKEEQEAVMRFIRQRMEGGTGGQQRNRNRGQGAGEGGSERPKRPAADDSE